MFTHHPLTAYLNIRISLHIRADLPSKSSEEQLYRNKRTEKETSHFAFNVLMFLYRARTISEITKVQYCII